MANNQSWEYYQQALSGNTIANLFWMCGAANGAVYSPGRQLIQNVLMAVPFDQMRAVTASRIAIQVLTAGNAGAKCRLGIYQNAGSTDSAPRTLVEDGGELDITTTGFKSLTIDVNLTADTRYWAALLSNNTNAVVAALQPQSIIFWGAALSGGVLLPASGVQATQNYGALPNSFPSPTLVQGASMPAIALGFSNVS